MKYAQHVADRFDLVRDIQFNVRAKALRFDEQSDFWTVMTDAGAQISARYCIMATGCLSSPREPNIPGVGLFAGARYHTARWPQDGVDFAGMRVGVIGTGSTGIQIIPQIARDAKHLHVFQRTANYSLPAKNRLLDEQEVVESKSHYREHRRRMRTSETGMLWPQENRSALALSDSERTKIFETNWTRWGLGANISDLGVDLSANETLAEFVREKICEVVRDPSIADLLLPTDHPIGTKANLH